MVQSMPKSSIQDWTPFLVRSYVMMNLKIKLNLDEFEIISSVFASVVLDANTLVKLGSKVPEFYLLMIYF